MIRVSYIFKAIEVIQNNANQIRALIKELEQKSYLATLKRLTPILLGIGIGVRLARTHYDVEAEIAKGARMENSGQPANPSTPTTDAVAVVDAPETRGEGGVSGE